jgi:lincosamide nucleotidyltransferase A/C/D/E
MSTMNPRQVLRVLDRLDAEGVTVWLDGGWGVDALLGEQTRPHDDLDLAIARGDCPRAQEALAALGFHHAPEVEPGLPARLVLRTSDGSHVDLHPLVMDVDGNGWQELPDGGWGLYPADGLRGHGEIAGRPVLCTTPELQLRHHLGYRLADRDRHDLRLLAERFGLPLPPHIGDG